MGTEHKKEPEGQKKQETSQKKHENKEAVDVAAGKQPEVGAGPDVQADLQPETGGIEADMASQSERVSELSTENADLLDSLKRLQAEFGNYRKRMVKEQTRILETAEAELVRKLLPVIDNLERALANSGGRVKDDALRGGVAMVLEQMLEILEKEGLDVIDPGGEPFDPENHEAMMVVETDECPEDTVTDVAQKGYRFNGRLLRPAMVHVSCPVKSAPV
jgi:molecular chaperone GrpE